MAHVVNPDLVAFVRLAEGGVVQLNAGDTVPAGADKQHVAELTEAGVLAQVDEPKAPRSGGKPGSGDQS